MADSWPSYSPPVASVDHYPVVRVSVAGPEPFNTLVVVRCRVTQESALPSDGHLRHARVGFETPFVLWGYDPRVDTPFQHSTTAVLQNLQLSDDTSFLASIDSLDGYFDETGRWIITADFAGAVDGEASVVGVYISSWVLCYEPPPETPPAMAPNDPRFRRLSRGSLPSAYEIGSGAGNRDGL
jgi:hypothetical protein